MRRDEEANDWLEEQIVKGLDYLTLHRNKFIYSGYYFYLFVNLIVIYLYFN